MNEFDFSDLGRHYQSALRLGVIYFESLITHIEDSLDRFEQAAAEEARRDGLMLRDDVAGYTFSSRQVSVDIQGCQFTEFSSSLTRLRLYCNYPPGWIFGELVRLAPWTGRSKCFAVGFVKQPNGRDHASLLGCYSELSFFNFDGLTRLILSDLISGDITDSDLRLHNRLVSG